MDVRSILIRRGQILLKFNPRVMDKVCKMSHQMRKRKRKKMKNKKNRKSLRLNVIWHKCCSKFINPLLCNKSMLLTKFKINKIVIYKQRDQLNSRIRMNLFHNIIMFMNSLKTIFKIMVYLIIQMKSIILKNTCK